MRRNRISPYFFGNRLVVVQPSLSIGNATQSANVFLGIREQSNSNYVKAAKDIILAAVVFINGFFCCYLRTC